MVAELTAGIVRILTPDGKTAGTGFMVGEEGLVATCAHVVEASGGKPGDIVRIVFHATGQETTANVESEGWCSPDAEDTAFLQFSDPLPEGVVSVGLGVSVGREGVSVQAFGYPDLGEVEGLWGEGRLIGPVTEAKRPLLQLRSSEITAGFSGGPVWDVATGHVIGMVTQVATPDRYGRLGEVAFAIPAETLAALRSLPLAKADPLAQMRSDYLASLRQRFEYLDLGGIAPRVQNRTVKLRMADIFVPLQARPEIESSLDLTDFMTEMPEDESDSELALRMLARSKRDASARPVNIAELLSKPHVVVLGDPGCGKSTLLRYVAYAIATGDGEAVGEAALARLPIFVRIVQYSQACTADPALPLDRYILEASAGKWATLFQATLDNGQALLLLDGLDEVIDAHQRKGIAEAMHTLAADYPGNQFLITSRIVGYQAARLTGDFAHYTVQPLSLERIAEFVQRWYTAIEREAGEIELSEEARERAEELSETIRARPGIRRLAENPLLLTIIALVNWRGRKLPNRRVELYAHAAETLIESWPYQRVGVRLETERVIRLLSPVAYRIFAARSAGDIAEDELLPVLAEAICRVDGVDQHEADKYAREFLGQVSEHSGIFRERGYDEQGRRVFGFLHLTFAEYFTARYLAGLWEGLGDDAEARRSFLRKYAQVPRWREVVLLMAGDVGLRDNDRAERTTRLLGDILELDSDYESLLHRDFLLAGECLADDLRVQPQAAQYVLSKLLELVAGPGVNRAVQTIFRSMRETTYGEPVLHGLLGRLEEPSWNAYANAAHALGVFGDSSAVEPLIAKLEDEKWRMRRSVAWALGQIQDPRAVESLLLLLDDDEGPVRTTAADALRNINSPLVIETLLLSLKDESNATRARAVWALGRIGDPQAVNPLLAHMQDPDRKVRWWATIALGMLGSTQAVGPLLAQLEHEDQELKLWAIEALGYLGGSQAAEPLFTRLEGRNRDVRWRAAEALGRIGDPRAVDPLLPCLGDEDKRVRWRAAEALGLLGAIRAMDPLLALLDDEDPSVRWRAIWALGEIGDSRALEPLLAQLGDEDKTVRWKAVEALGKLADARATKPLLRLLEDRSRRVRMASSEALGCIGNELAMGPLVHRLDAKDEDWRVLVSTYEALIAIVNQHTSEPEPEVGSCEPKAVAGPWDR